MTQPNQSELREHLSDILTYWFGAPEYNGFAASPDWGDLNTEIVTYITANYTPNSELERLVHEARVDELKHWVEDEPAYGKWLEQLEARIAELQSPPKKKPRFEP